MSATNTAQQWAREAGGGISRPFQQSGWTYLKNVAVLGGGSAIALGLTALLSPVLTRLYSPEAIGQYGVFSSFLNVAIVGVSLKYELSVLAVHSERKAAQLTFASFLFVIPMSLVGTACFFSLVHFSLLGFGALPLYATILMGIALIFGGAFYVLRYWFVREEGFHLVSQATVAQGSVRPVSQIAIGFLGFQIGGLLGGEVLGRCAGMSRMFRDALPKIKAHVFPFDFAGVQEALTENWRFPIYSLPSSLIDNISANISIPLIVMYYGTGAGGYYALVQRVLAIPLVLISASVADAFHGRLAFYEREKPDLVMPLFRNTSLWLIGLGIFPAILLLAFGEPMFHMVFGTHWTEAGKLAAVTSPLFLAQFVVSPLSRLVFVLEGQRFKLVYDTLALASMIGVFTFSAHHHYALIKAVTLLSLTGTLTFIVYYFVLIRVLQQHRQTREQTGAAPTACV